MTLKRAICTEDLMIVLLIDYTVRLTLYAIAPYALDFASPFGILYTNSIIFVSMLYYSSENLLYR